MASTSSAAAFSEDVESSEEISCDEPESEVNQESEESSCDEPESEVNQESDGSDSNSHEDIDQQGPDTQPSRKRSKHPESWKKSKRVRRRNSGKRLGVRLLCFKICLLFYSAVLLKLTNYSSYKRHYSHKTSNNSSLHMYKYTVR